MAEISIRRLEELVARHPHNEGYAKRLRRAQAEADMVEQINSRVAPQEKKA